MKVEMLESKWGEDMENLTYDYHVTLYKISDGESEWYRINIENTRDGRYARREFTGEGARVLAQVEFTDIVYGGKTPLQYAWI